jgi:hypothetical protein
MLRYRLDGVTSRRSRVVLTKNVPTVCSYSLQHPQAGVVPGYNVLRAIILFLKKINTWGHSSLFVPHDGDVPTCSIPRTQDGDVVSWN